MQPSVPHVFSSVLADLWLWIRVLRKEILAQRVLGRVAPGAIGYGGLVPSLEDELGCYRRPYRSTAMTANLDIDIEYALESLGPVHCEVPFSG